MRQLKLQLATIMFFLGAAAAMAGTKTAYVYSGKHLALQANRRTHDVMEFDVVVSLVSSCADVLHVHSVCCRVRFAPSFASVGGLTHPCDHILCR